MVMMVGLMMGRLYRLKREVYRRIRSKCCEALRMAQILQKDNNKVREAEDKFLGLIWITCILIIPNVFEVSSAFA